jgi:hypothetical protein
MKQQVIIMIILSQVVYALKKREEYYDTYALYLRDVNGT